MESYTDDRILGQPIGYWASMTGRSAVTFIRATLERHGLTQPQWWALNYIADRPAGVDMDEVVEYHRGFVDTDDALRPDTLALVMADDPHRLRRPLDQRAGRDHLVDVEAATVLAAQAAERRVGDAGHRGEHHGDVDGQRPQPQRGQGQAVRRRGGVAGLVELIVVGDASTRAGGLGVVRDVVGVGHRRGGEGVGRSHVGPHSSIPPGTRVTVPHDEARWEAIAEAPRRDGQTVLPAGQASDAGAASPPSSTASRSAPANI